MTPTSSPMSTLLPSHKSQDSLRFHFTWLLRTHIPSPSKAYYPWATPASLLCYEISKADVYTSFYIQYSWSTHPVSPGLKWEIRKRKYNLYPSCYPANSLDTFQKQSKSVSTAKIQPENKKPVSHSCSHTHKLYKKFKPHLKLLWEQVESLATTSLTGYSLKGLHPSSSPSLYKGEGEMQWWWLEYSFAGMSICSNSCSEEA